MKYKLFLLGILFLSGCQTVPLNVDVTEEFANSNHTYNVVSKGDNHFTSYNLSSYNEQLKDAVNQSYTIAQTNPPAGVGIGGQLAGGFVGSLIVGASVKYEHDRIKYFIDPIAKDYSNFTLHDDLYQNITEILGNQAWVNFGTPTTLETVESNNTPYVLISTSHDFTYDFRSIIIHTQVAFYHPESTFGSAERPKAIPVYRRYFTFTSEPLAEPDKTEAIIDAKVAKVRAEFEQQPEDIRKSDYHKEVFKNDIRAARKSEYTQDERSDILRSQWLENDAELIDLAIQNGHEFIQQELIKTLKLRRSPTDA